VVFTAYAAPMQMLFLPVTHLPPYAKAVQHKMYFHSQPLTPSKNEEKNKEKNNTHSRIRL
jgi:hypothetical protein